MATFTFPEPVLVQVRDGSNAQIPQGLWPAQVSGLSVRVQVGESEVELDLDQWDSILREGLALPTP
ncbi:hypothetical protein [Niveibacterium sp. SC-1]|uniref:hypothetical protein n=1 Tax=Niveibacterium sp. SC-1 TaxID=3135646 RepID=UPI00311DCB00